MICKYFCPLSWLPLHFVDGFLCCAEAVLGLSFFFFTLLIVLLVSYPENHCQDNDFDHHGLVLSVFEFYMKGSIED